MDNRNFLSEALVLEGLIRTKKETLRKHKSRREYMSPDFSKDKVSSGNVNAVQESQDEYLQIEKEIEADIRIFKRRYAVIYRAIKAVEDPQARELLEMRYLQGKRMGHIAAVKNYGSRQIRRKLRAAEMLVKVPKTKG